MLTHDQVESFNRNGYLVLKSFYDKSEIQPIWGQISQVISILAEDEGIEIDKKGDFDDGIMQLLAKDRKFIGRVYDAAKQLPAFCRLLCCTRHDEIFTALRPDSSPAVAAGGQGIRIDLPREERFRTIWHQDFLTQLRSRDSLVFWAPLRKLTPELGPVEVCVGSHRDGPRTVVVNEPPNDPTKPRGYRMVIRNEEKVVSGYERQAPLLDVGDLLVFDFMLIHQSSHNLSTKARWSMQMRYFNFLEPEGRRIEWVGSFAAGVKVGDVYPDLVA